jgi:hypothetical protein
MLLHALSTPLLKSLFVGGALLGAAIGVKVAAPDGTRLVLDAPKECGAIYLTRFDDGDMRMDVGTKLEPMTFTNARVLDDRCRYLGIETLVPLDAKTFQYFYDEELLGCEPGAVPGYRKTPRTGYVHVVD